MFELRDEQSNDIRPWSLIIPDENSSNIVYSNENIVSDEENAQPPEARAWSTHQNTNLENILDEGPTKNQKVFLSSTSQRQQQPSKEDSRGVEQILSYIDRRRPPRQK
jgi:hypothetical protein